MRAPAGLHGAARPDLAPGRPGRRGAHRRPRAPVVVAAPRRRAYDQPGGGRAHGRPAARRGPRGHDRPDARCSTFASACSRVRCPSGFSLDDPRGRRVERERPHRAPRRCTGRRGPARARRRLLRRPRRRQLRRAPPARRGALLGHDDARHQRHRARLPDPRVQGRTQLLADRADRRADALLGRRRAGAVAHGRGRVAEAPGPRRARPPSSSPRSWSTSTGSASSRSGHAFSARHRLAARDGGPLPLHADRRPGPGDRGREGRHGEAAPDGPPGLRRRRLRQDRDRGARRLQGGPGQQAGGGPRAHHAAREPALRHVLRALRGLPGEGRAAEPLRRRRRGQPDDLQGLQRGDRRRRDRHPPAAVRGRRLQGPRAAGGRRGAALRRHATRRPSRRARSASTC